MQKKPLIFTLIGIAIGSGFGYMAGTNQATSEGPATITEQVTVNRTPRFGDNRTTGTSAATENGSRTVGNKGSIDSLLQKYSRMSAAEVEAEIKELGGVNLFEREPDLKKVMALVYLSYKWGRLAPQQALQETQSMGVVSMITTPLVLSGWAEVNPEGAAAYYAENKNKFPQGQAMVTLLAAEMGKSSPEKAMKWAAGLSDAERKQAIPTILSEIAENHPEQMSSNIGMLSETDLKNTNLCADIASKWAQSNWDEANKWIDTLDEKQQKAARQKALGSLGMTDLNKATEVYKSLDSEDQSSAAGSIVSNLSRKGGVEALEWLVNNTSEEVAVKNIGSSISYFSSYEQSQEMTEYIQGLPSGTIKDNSMQEFINRNIRQFNDSANYENSLALSASIGDETKRNATTENVVNRWANSEPEKAAEWIPQSSLPQETKDKLLKRCEDVIKRNAENN